MAVPPYMLEHINESDFSSEKVFYAAKNTLVEHTATLAYLRDCRMTELTTPTVFPIYRPLTTERTQEVDRGAKEDRDFVEKASNLQNLPNPEQDYNNMDPFVPPTYPPIFAPWPEGRSERIYGVVYDAENRTVRDKDFPGPLVHRVGQELNDDNVVNEVWRSMIIVLNFFANVFGWRSYDNQCGDVRMVVHYSKNYMNINWDPVSNYFLFGDGAEGVLYGWYLIDMVGHEFTHAVVAHIAPLLYVGESGALNEHLGDVFGIMARQWFTQQDTDQTDWLFGKGGVLVGDEDRPMGLRSLKAPGTAYTSSILGNDPQPAFFRDFDDKDYRWADTATHLNSGIPNKAFYLVAHGLGGRSGRIPKRCTFLQFADITVDTASELYGLREETTVRDAWNAVGVMHQGPQPGGGSVQSKSSVNSLVERAMTDVISNSMKGTTVRPEDVPRQTIEYDDEATKKFFRIQDEKDRIKMATEAADLDKGCVRN
ncbi:metalloprotease [Xylariaceae sp. FL0255]|nr:metalloprotease [Xylariaceae sp. FL0255]